MVFRLDVVLPADEDLRRAIIERSVAMVVEKILTKIKLTPRHTTFQIKGTRKNTSWMKTKT